MDVNEEIVEAPKVEESILGTIKKMLGITYDYEQFDVDIIVHINSAFATLAQIGSELKEGYTITDKYNVWSEYTEDIKILDMIKTYIYLKTRLIFDPPASSMVAEAIKSTIKELEFRIQLQTDSKEDDQNADIQ